MGSPSNISYRLVSEADFSTLPQRWFVFTTTWPGVVLAAAAVILASAAAFLPRLTRDVSANAFIATDHPSLNRQRDLEAAFGGRESMVIVLVAEGPHGVFTPEALHLVGWITERAAAVNGIDPTLVTSLTTVATMSGTEGEIFIEPLVPQLDDRKH